MFPNSATTPIDLPGDYDQFATGTAAELLDKAARLLAEHSQPAGDLNERLLRHYITLKAVDRPMDVSEEDLDTKRIPDSPEAQPEKRPGAPRKRFGYRHLLQLVTVRRLMDVNYPLPDIAQHTRTASTASLENNLRMRRAMKTPAELFFAEFRAAEARGNPYEPTTRFGRAPSSLKPGAVGLVDLYRLLNEINGRLGPMLRRFATTGDYSKPPSSSLFDRDEPDYASSKHDNHLENQIDALQRSLDEKMTQLERELRQQRLMTHEMNQCLNAVIQRLESADRTHAQTPSTHQPKESRNEDQA